MADFGIMIAEKLVEAIASEVIKEICTLWGYESELEDLKKTVITIQKVLVDAEAIRELSNEQQHFISELKDAVYDADDLFDELRTLAELNQIQPLTKGGMFYEKVRRFFSSKNQLGQAYRMSRDVKDIKKRLDGIADNHQNYGFCVDNHQKYGFCVDNHQKYGFSVDNKPIIRRREETCSYVDANDIIGRDNDKEAIVDMLLNPNNYHGEDFVAVTVVGVGGLGKTALAQLVFNDERVMKEFPESRFWVCVSDQDGVPFDVKTILCQILQVVSHRKLDDSSPMELVQQQFQETLKGKKYLLVLDDVWNEERVQWLKLRKFLILGQGGSRVVVTTRSNRTGTIIGEKHAYELKGLSQDDSWRLFKMSAFDDITDKLENHHEFVEMGKKIAAKCYNIPLALKVVGSMLFGQGISQWRSFEDVGLAHIGKGKNEILSILKLSYYNLEPSFKYCFGYCALFPKDDRIEKQNLIDLWIAQGYITPLIAGQCLEDVAEEHFLILLRRCFFQDVKKNQYGEVLSVKIHDLMHDVALEVGREEFRVVTSSLAKNDGDKTRHLQYRGDTTTFERLLGSSKIRSFICKISSSNCVITQFDKWMCLRVLDLSTRNYNCGFKNLPISIGKLLHLRYLNLSKNDNLEVLPDEITRLHNLQTLLLCNCRCLRELPEDFSKLVNLRHLDLDDCEELQCMPLGMGKMTSLKVLPYYVVGKSDGGDGLKVLKALTGIRRGMKITIGGNYIEEEEEEGVNNEREGVGGYLKGLEHLKNVEIKFDWKLENQAVLVNHEAVLVNLEPPSNVKVLKIWSYKGKTIPKWGRAMNNWASSLSHLVHISFWYCTNLEEMPVLSRLRHLKSLDLSDLYNLEYMEMVDIKRSDGGTKSSEEELGDTLFFPSLVTLNIWNLKKLKGWWKKSSGVDDCSSSSSSYNSRFTLSFPRLSELVICDCPNLTMILLCPRIETLHLRNNNRSFQVIVNTTEAMDDNTAGNSQQHLKLLKLETDNLDLLKSLPINRLASFRLFDFEDVDSTILEILASSLQTLQVDKLKTLRRLCGETWLQNFPNFTALVDLSVGYYFPYSIEKENEEENEEENELEQCSFPPNLHSLKFTSLSKMKSLPKGMQCLTSLQTLFIYHCKQLEALPEWISCLSSLKSLDMLYCPALKSLPEAMQKLTSLQTLRITYCWELEDRCKEPDGEDRPKIQHIPNIYINHRKINSQVAY